MVAKTIVLFGTSGFIFISNIFSFINSSCINSFVTKPIPNPVFIKSTIRL